MRKEFTGNPYINKKIGEKEKRAPSKKPDTNQGPAESESPTIGEFMAGISPVDENKQDNLHFFLGAGEER